MVLTHYWNFIKYLFEPSGDTHWWTAFWCRLNNHPDGVVWYNATGWEPDMTCKRCGDNLG